MEEILFFIAKAISLIIAAAICFLVLHRLPTRRIKWLFFLSIAGFAASTLFFDAGDEMDWTMHFIFIFGQISFILFINDAVDLYEQMSDEPKITEKKPVNAILGGFFMLPLLGGLGSFFKFITDQGIQHVIAGFFAIAAVSFMRTRLMTVEIKRKKFPFYLLASAIIILAFIHIGEFFIESQKVFVLPPQITEAGEFILAYVGMVLLGIGACKIACLPTRKTIE